MKILAAFAVLFLSRPCSAAPAIEQLRVMAGAIGVQAPRVLPIFRIKEVMPPDFPGGDPVAEGIDPLQLQNLLRRADDEHSSAVLILRNGKLLAAQGAWDRKIFAMSVTKSIVSLAVGLLIEDGLIQSLNQPVSDFFPQWSTGEKSKITIRMLLNHTSGLDTKRVGMRDPKGTVAHALKSPLVFSPGTDFDYNNNAVDFLAGVIEKASGERADFYIDRRLFAPMGISDTDWARDVLGTPLTAGELIIRPIDLAKIGQMALDGGLWEGRRIINQKWLEESVKTAQPFDPSCGLLWWINDRPEERSVGFTPGLVERWIKAGVRPEILEPLRPLIGRPMRNIDELREALQAAYRGRYLELKELNDHWMRGLQFCEIVKLGPVDGFYAWGYLGQFLVVDPKLHLVAVRMRSAREDESGNRDNFPDFPQLVPRLVTVP